jgi:hypothetical protein
MKFIVIKYLELEIKYEVPSYEISTPPPMLHDYGIMKQERKNFMSIHFTCFPFK